MTAAMRKVDGVLRSKHPLYVTWQAMKSRCSQPTCKTFKYYGGRGISVCARWAVFDLFANDVGPKPTLGHSLDRINNDGNYEPANVRWATRTTQRANRSGRSSLYRHSATITPALGINITRQAWPDWEQMNDRFTEAAYGALEDLIAEGGRVDEDSFDEFEMAYGFSFAFPEVA